MASNHIPVLQSGQGAQRANLVSQILTKKARSCFESDRFFRMIVFPVGAFADVPGKVVQFTNLKLTVIVPTE